MLKWDAHDVMVTIWARDICLEKGLLGTSFCLDEFPRVRRYALVRYDLYD